jgi:hypothetical protein
MEKMIMEIVREKIDECAVRYNFDGEEAMRELVLKKVEKKCILLPFNEKNVCKDGCQGLKYNQGLFTQCEKKVDGEYCDGCRIQGEKNGTGIPDCGTIGERLSMGLNFKDRKGRIPISYQKLMKNKKWTEEEVREEAEKCNKVIEDSDFIRKEKIVEKRGRPKKAAKEVESTGITDLFANVLEETEELVIEPLEAIEDEKVSKKAEKEAAKAAKDAEKEAAKAAKDAEKEAAKAAREAEKEAKKKTKEAKPKEAKEAKPKEAKEAKPKEAKEAKPKEAKEAKPKEKETKEKKAEPATKKVQVDRVIIDGKEYLKSNENILYDEKTKDEVGIYCEKTKSILPLPDDEEEEEEYESD